MIKKMGCFLVVISFCFSAQSQKKVDSVALLILDHMSDVIGDLGSCSYHLSTATDVTEYGHGLEKKFAEHEVYMVGPDMMLVQSRGSGFHKGYWYDGEIVVYYSYTENNYAVMDAPSTIMETIDSIHQAYGLEFPAADFFYPTFTDDILENFDQVLFLGNKEIDGKDCFHILASNKAMTIQLWLTNDAMTLPEKFVINYKSKEGSPQYEATFSEWKLNPILPYSLFEFTPPPGSHEVGILAKSDQ
jgi:hypothetical protein